MRGRGRYLPVPLTFYVSQAVKNRLAHGQSITLERNGQTYDAATSQIVQSVDA